jgi:hypothetical protein
VRDALVYRFCIEQVEEELVTATRANPNIRGGSKISPNADPSEDGYYEKSFKDWMEHNEAIREGLESRPVAASTDIASYFEGIDLTLLSDLVRSTVSGKPGVVTLLDFFLRQTKVQYDYGLNVNTGLPQEDIDCSRMLAYFYLHPHDDRLIKFTLEHDGELFRFADDITILVDTETKARHALKAVTESLRDLGLVASIEKTEIMPSAVVADQLMYAENAELEPLELRARQAAKSDNVPPEVAVELEALYRRWRDGPESDKRNWRKVLKRFYTIATLLRAPFLIDDLEAHLIEYPSELQEKISKYLVRIQRTAKIGDVVERLLRYLRSEENLYASLETSIIESFLYLDSDAIPAEARASLGGYGRALALEDGPALSDYARAIGALLCFKFDRAAVDDIAARYLKEPVGSGIVRKYMVFAALTTDDETLRGRVLARARSEQDPSLNRLIGLIENLPNARKTSAVKSYIKRTKIYFLGIEVTADYSPVRQEILGRLIEIYGGA